MSNDVPQLYSIHQRRLLPIRERIMDAIYSGEEDITVAEIVGLLETIKFEIMIDHAEG